VDELHDYLSRLREEFTHGTLDEGSSEKDPSQQFRIWMHHAIEAKVPELQAMTLCTAAKNGRPASRIVYLREFRDHDYFFYTNYKSRKGKELGENPFASVSFFWPQLQRQVRIEGRILKTTEEKSDAYFNARPYDSKVGAWASNQSEPLSSRDELEQRVQALRLEYPEDRIKRPPHWGGYILQADYYEFWQGRPSRLHDRLTYSLEKNKWKMERLAP
jgi:pyridoxamine 5'-phosphate oxidase